MALTAQVCGALLGLGLVCERQCAKLWPSHHHGSRSMTASSQIARMDCLALIHIAHNALKQVWCPSTSPQLPLARAKVTESLHQGL